MISFTIFVYLLLICFEDFSWTMMLCGLVAQGFHFSIMNNFPFIQMLSVPLIGSVAMLVINHVLAFQYFTSVYVPFTQVSHGEIQLGISDVIEFVHLCFRYLPTLPSACGWFPSLCSSRSAPTTMCCPPQSAAMTDSWAAAIRMWSATTSRAIRRLDCCRSSTILRRRCCRVAARNHFS